MLILNIFSFLFIEQYTPILEHNIDIPSNNLYDFDLISIELLIIAHPEKYPFNNPTIKHSGAINAFENIIFLFLLQNFNNPSGIIYFSKNELIFKLSNAYISSGLAKNNPINIPFSSFNIISLSSNVIRSTSTGG